jgi:hypothetical protein
MLSGSAENGQGEFCECYYDLGEGGLMYSGNCPSD